MKYNSKGALVCSVASMLMLGSATISVAWLATQHKLMSSLDGYWDVSGLEALWESVDLGDREKAEELRGVYDAEFEKVVADYPELKPVWKKVPDAENGFLAWLDFLEKHMADGGMTGTPKLEIPAEVAAIIRNDGKWDGEGAVEVVSRYLKDNRALLDEIIRIAQLPSQSTAGVLPERYAFINASFIRSCAHLLCADARVAARNGEEQRALTSIQAALGLANHHSRVETPSLIFETVAMLLRLETLRACISDVMPHLKLNQEKTRRWREVMRQEPRRDYSQLVVGESYVMMRALLVPLMYADGRGGERRRIPDPEVFCDASAYYAAQLVSRYHGLSLRDCAETRNSFWESGYPRPLSRATQAMMRMSEIGWPIYFKGLTRAEVTYRYFDAAFAIAAGDEPPEELITGKAFVYDAASRVLSLPDDAALDELRIQTVVVP
jgi:hypothetical protein